MLTICTTYEPQNKWRGNETYVGAHASDEHDRSSALWDHVARGLSRSEKGAMDINIIQLLYAVDRVAGNVGSVLER